MAPVPGTIMQLKSPKSTEESKFPYDEVEIVGPSPILHPARPGEQEWSGAAAQGVVIRPLTGYASNLDEPWGKIQALYNVVSKPEVPEDAGNLVIAKRPLAETRPSPEEVFAEKAPGEPAADGGRARTPIGSPLEDPRPKTSSSPLDQAGASYEASLQNTEVTSEEEAGVPKPTRTRRRESSAE